MTLAEELAACETRDFAAIISRVALNSKSSKQANGRKERKALAGPKAGSTRSTDAANKDVGYPRTIHDRAGPAYAAGQDVPS